MTNIPINSGTGPRVAVDLSGTENYQIVKIMQASSGATSALSPALLVTGSLGITVTSGTFVISALTTGTVNVVNVLSASGVTVASVATGTVNVVNVLSASGVTVANVATGTMHVTNVLSATGVVVAQVTTLLGTVSVSGGGGGVQYAAGDTSMAATGTGNIIIGMQSGATTGRAMVITTTGGLIIGSMPAVGGGQQYAVDSTAMAATGTGTLIIGMQSGATTGRGIAVTTTGGLVIGVMPAVGGGQQYPTGDTSMAATATGTVILGMQSGATTGRAMLVTTTGSPIVTILGTQAVTAANVTIASVTTGTMNVVNVLSASGVTIASVATGTVNVVNVLSATGVLVAALTTGTVNVVNSVGVIGTAHASRWDAFAVNTTSGAAVIVKTSGAHTLYITDMILSVDVPSMVNIYSAATTKMSLYLATKGGMAVGLTSPIVLNSAQSLTFQPSVSGSSMLWAAGYTVT